MAENDDETGPIKASVEVNTDDEFSDYSDPTMDDVATPGAPVIRWDGPDAHLIGMIVGTFILEDGEIYHVEQTTLDRNKRNDLRRERNIARLKKKENQNAYVKQRIQDYKERDRLIKEQSDLFKRIAKIDDDIEKIDQRLNTNRDGTLSSHEIKRRLKRKFVKHRQNV